MITNKTKGEILKMIQNGVLRGLDKKTIDDFTIDLLRSWNKADVRTLYRGVVDRIPKRKKSKREMIAYFKRQLKATNREGSMEAAMGLLDGWKKKELEGFWFHLKKGFLGQC